jgi:hypothetical protein
MWQVMLDFLIVFGMVLLGVVIIMAIGLGVAFLKILIVLNKAEELEKMVNCDHDNTQYCDWSPDGKWKCNDCGKLY